jgi:hypothetical protein
VEVAPQVRIDGQAAHKQQARSLDLRNLLIGDREPADLGTKPRQGMAHHKRVATYNLWQAGAIEAGINLSFDTPAR